MARSTFVIVTCLLLLVMGRPAAECQPRLRVEPVPVRSVRLPAHATAGSPIRIKVTCLTRTPCWVYHNTSIVRRGSSLFVTVNAAYDGRPCIQVLATFDTTLTLPPVPRGRRLLQFWTGQHSTLDTLILVGP